MALEAVFVPGVGWTNVRIPAIIAPNSVVMAANLNSDGNGNKVIAMPEAGLILAITVNTLGQFVVDRTTSGMNTTVNFRKLKEGLNITLGTLLTVTAFEDVAGIVNFDVVAFRAFS